MKVIVRSLVFLIIFLTCLLSFGCTQTDDLVFLNDEVAIDADGNVYGTVTINNQVWMTENLKTTRYRNGELIDKGPLPKTYDDFFDLSREFEPKYQWPCNGLEDEVTKGGRLYTWYAAIDNRNICPLGWHLPTDEEWQSLKTFLITSNYGRYDKKGKRKDEAAIGIALASGYENWAGPPKSVFFYDDYICNDFTEHNTTGFSAYPSGCFYGDFVYDGMIALWRSTSPNNSWSINYMGTSLNNGETNIPWSLYSYSVFGIKPYDGYSVRCIKDGANATQDISNNGVIILAISNPTVLNRSATQYVNIISDGGSKVSERGLCWSTSPTPTTSMPTKTVNGSGKGQFLAEITGLSASTTYFVRAYATNKYGTNYSREISFVTKDGVIELTTIDAASVSNSSATLGVTIINVDNVDVLSKGVCWNTVPNPTVDLTTKTIDGSGSDNYTSSIFGLDPLKKYYARAYAISNVGTFYGNEIQFKTGISDPIKDIDGNEYHYVKIGNLTWMTENLKTTRYRDGTIIPYVHDTASWKKLKAGAYSIYDNESKNADIYGCLYNWYAVIDSRNIAPTGWHVAKIGEWNDLITQLGGVDKMKETGINHWLIETGVTNESGFTALPGGYCNENGVYVNLRSMGSWWGVQSANPYYYMDYFILHTLDSRNYYDFKEERVDYNVWRMRLGMSVRCVKDN